MAQLLYAGEIIFGAGKEMSPSYGSRREPKSSASTNLTATLRVRPTTLRFVVAYGSIVIRANI